MTGELPFVGRTSELAALHGWFDEAIHGAPRTVLLRGEPGVGKTRLLDRFTADVVRRVPDALVLRSTCYEDARVPYLPLATALRPLGDLTSFLGPPTDDAPEGADERRLRLYVGTADLVSATLRARPLVLVIDDLHWADQGTIDLLGHLSQIATSSLTVLAHRPMSGGPPVELLERLQRLEWCREIDITGLDPFSLHELVEALTGELPSRKLLDGLQEASGGNPMLVRALLARLEAFGMLTVRSGQLTHRGGEEVLAGPAELDGLLRHRLRDLPRACLEMLVVSAFLGEGQPITDAQLVMGGTAERFERAVAEAVDAGVLRDDETIRFDHPQLLHVVHQRPRGRRRQELHLRVADHLERLGGDEASRIVAIAHHLRRAGDLPDADRVLRANLAAASQAASAVAWGEAALAYDAAIEVEARSGEPVSAFRALLHARSAYAHWYNHDNPGAVEHALAAIEIASALGDLPIWTEGLEMLARGWWSGPAGAYGTQHDLTPFDSFLAAAGDREPELRARVHRTRGTLKMQSLDLDGGRNDLDAAMVLIRGSSDLRLVGDVSYARGSIHIGDAELDRAVAIYEHSLECNVKAGAELLQVTTIRGLAMAHWAMASLERAAAYAHDAVAKARPIAAWAECSNSLAVLTGIAVARGDDEEAEAAGASAERILRWSGYPPTAQMLYAALACVRARRGDFAGAHDALDEWELHTPRSSGRYRAIVYAMAGDTARVKPLRPRPMLERPNFFDLGALASAIEVGDLLDDLDRIAWAAPGITSLATRGARFELSWCFFVPRLAGVAALRLGQLDEAARWFAVAAEAAARAGATPEAERVARDTERLRARAGAR